MKKMMFTMLFTFIAAFACVFTVSADDLVASAVNDFEIVVTELTAVAEPGTQVGDLKVTVSIADAQPYAGFGYGLYYNGNDYAPVLDTNGNTVCTYHDGVLGAAMDCQANPTKNMYGIVGGSATNIRTGGDMISVYLRPLDDDATSAPITDFVVTQLANADKELMTYTEPTTYEYTYVSQAYVIGDVNGDGVIDSVDSVIVSQVVEANGGSISAEDFSENTPFIEYDDVVCIGVVDADGDNDIDADDSREILIYYRNTSIMGTPYEGLVGTTGYYYTEVLPL